MSSLKAQIEAFSRLMARLAANASGVSGPVSAVSALSAGRHGFKELLSPRVIDDIRNLVRARRRALSNRQAPPAIDDMVVCVRVDSLCDTSGP